MDDPAARSFNPSTLGEAMARRLYRRAVVTAQITVPAVPSMIDEYVNDVRQRLCRSRASNTPPSNPPN